MCPISETFRRRMPCTAYKAVTLGGGVTHLGTIIAAAIMVAWGRGAFASVAIATRDYGPDRPLPNDCAGVFGKSFDAWEDPNGSPVIAKWEVNSKFELAGTDTLADLFTLTYDDGSTSSGTWEYNQCATCVGVTSWVAKDGDGFRWFYQPNEPRVALTSGSWNTLGKGLSHITFYDSAVAPVPVPAALPLLALGLGGLGFAARRQRRAA
jgi:hypothetical protein